MLEPLRVRTMKRMAERLATIQEGTVVYTDPPASVEYATSPSLVSRSLLWITQYAQPLGVEPTPMATQLDAGPVLGVMRSSGSKFNGLLQPVHTRPIVDSMEHLQRVTVWGYVQATDDLLAADLIEMLWEDCVRCLYADPKLGGLCALKISTDDEALDTDNGDLEPQAFFAQDWLIQARATA